jgi:SnoaL-like domain
LDGAIVRGRATNGSPAKPPGDQLGELHRRAADGLKHVTTNLIVETDPDGLAASARLYYFALQGLPDLPLQPILAGRWHDRFEKVDGHWRFVERLIYTDLAGDISRHLKGGS